MLSYLAIIRNEGTIPYVLVVTNCYYDDALQKIHTYLYENNISYNFNIENFEDFADLQKNIRGYQECAGSQVFWID